MTAEKVILGLDIGVGSIGWGLVKITEEEYSDEKPDGSAETKHRIVDGRIIATGVRAFQVPQDREKKSLALQRGRARRLRKTTRRKAQRLKRLRKLGKEFHLVDDSVGIDEILKPKKGDTETKWDIWFIRKQALERKLSDIELFRVLYHIAKHRGFFFHTKAEEEIQEEDKKSDAGDVKKGLKGISKKLQEGPWKTVGQMFCEEFTQSNDQNRRKRNTRDKYEHSIHRSLLKDEVETIFQQQQKLGNSKAVDELKQRYIDEILMSEEGIDDNRLQQMMSHCEFTGGLCAPKEGYTSERFSLFNRLNTLEFTDTQNRDSNVTLARDQRAKIVALAYKNAGGVTFAQIRTELGLQDDLHLRFNLCSYREKNPEYDKKLKCVVKNGCLQFDDKQRIPVVNINTGEVQIYDDEIKHVFKQKKLWPARKDVSLYYSDIRKQLNLSGDFRFADLKGYQKSPTELGGEGKYLKQFEDDTFIELKGYHKIRRAIEKHCGDDTWAHLGTDTNRLETIAESLVYHKSDDTRTEYLKENGIVDGDIIKGVLTINMKQLASYSRVALDRLLEYMEKGDLFNEAKAKTGFGKLEYDKQPILKPYSGFFEDNPAVARVISQTRKLINALIRKYQERHPIDQIHIEIATELASSDKRKNQIAQGQRRYREAKEAAEERCRDVGLDPEEGQNLLMFRLAEEQNYFCPYTGAKITLYPTGAANEVYIKDCEIDHVIPMSRSFNDSLNNKVLCTPESNQNKTDRIPFEWFEDMYGKDSVQWMELEKAVMKMYGVPYPKRRNLIRKSWTEKDKEKFLSRNLNDTRYAARHIADYLRKYFDFSKSSRDDIEDDSRIQVRSGGITAFLRHMWGLNKDRGANDLHHAIDALVVACSTYGHVYLVSNLARQMERKGKNWYKHFGRDKFRPWADIRRDIQTAVDGVFVSRMPRHTVTAAAHKETIVTLNAPNKNRTLRIRGGYAEMGDMVRADVFVDKAGRNYVVPIYAVDIFSNRPLPDKYLPKDDAPYEEWPVVTDGKLEFGFSLFKDDLVSLGGQMYYVDYIRATRSQISVKKVDGSPIDSTKGQRSKEVAYRNVELKKYSVDMLGNYKQVQQEKRLGNRVQSRI